MQISIAFDPNEGFALVGKKLEALSVELKKLGGAATAANNVTDLDDAPAPAVKPRRGRPPGPAKPPETEPEDDLGSDDPPPPEDEGDDLGFGEDPPPKAPKVKLDDVRLAFRTFSQSKSMDKAKAVMKRLGVTRLDQLKPDQYALALKSVGA